MKVIFLGHTGAGKTLLIRRLLKRMQARESSASPSPPRPRPAFSANPAPSPSNLYQTPSYRDKALGLGQQPRAAWQFNRNNGALAPALGGSRSTGSPLRSATRASSFWKGSDGRHPNAKLSSLSVGDQPVREVVMSITEITPTMSLQKGRKRIAGSSGGYKAEEEEEVEGGMKEAGDEAGSATPSISGGGTGSPDMTLKLWDFGGTEKFHSVHGLFFSG